MKPNRIDHLGIVVENLETALETWRDALGLEFVEIEEVQAEKVRVAMFKIGESRIELLTPTSDETGVAKFLKKRGEGIHHVCIEVDNVEQSLAELEGKGVQLINREPIIGAGGRKAAFLHPRSFNGVLLEIYQKDK